MPPGSSAIANAGRPNFSFSRAATRPTMPGMPALGGGDHHRALLLDAERGHRFGLGLRQGFQLDGLALAVEPVELGGDARRLDRIVLEQKPHAEIGAADAPAGIDARTKQKTEMPRLGGTGEPRHVHQADVAGALAPAQRDQALGDESAVEPGERHHVGDGAERHIIEKRQKIGLGTLRGPKAAGAQHAVDRHHGHEGQAHRGEMAEAGKIVAPVRIDDRHGRRQHLVGLVVIDDDDVDTERARFHERLDAGGAAIDRHQERGAARGERPHRLDVGAIAFEQPVGNVDQRVDAGLAQEARQQRGGGRAVDVVIAEHGDRLATHDRVGNPRRRLRHGGEHVGIGHRLA